ncbi:DUF1254 domain-containing protein [Rhodococcus opacus]|uniref:DUF1254 domain-containing protein n=1 Tax=Rhodococcus opacus TaxID=37919 RepID=UPI00080BE830|nr:DUF1254 domain-containing protein [Rhodococcus opacus]
MEQTTQVTQRTRDSISTPPKVETHLGTLEFPLGVTTDETANRVYDHLDQLHAINAFLNALPGVNLWALRHGFLDAGIADNDVVLWPQMMDSGSLVLAGSADSLYFCSFPDSSTGPLVIEIPPLTLTFINDLWSRWIIDGGTAAPTGVSAANTC